jgi:hypothetical protein
MRWWLRSHRVIWAAVLAAATGFGTSLLSNSALALPTLTGSNPFADVPLYSAVPLVVIILLGTVMDGAGGPLYEASSRRTRFMDLAFSIAVVTIAILACQLGAQVGSTTAPEIARNIVGLVGIFWLSAPIIGYRYAVLPPAIYVFASIVFGRLPGGDLSSAWAWVLSSDSTLDSWPAPVSLFAAGAIWMLVKNRRLEAR